MITTPPEVVRSRLAIAFVLGLLSAFGPLSMDFYLAALPAVGASLGVGASASQLTMAACLVGLGLGQLMFGPLSDRLGRRRPVLVGVAAFVVFSVFCAIAWNAWVLILFRFLQGLGGSAGIVVSRAVARDLFDGQQLTRMLSLLALVGNTVPVIAPIAGGLVTLVTDWRGIFFGLAVIGAALFAVAYFGMPESLPRARRHTGTGQSWRRARSLVGDRRFIAMILTLGCTSAAFFSYLSMASFIFQDQYGLSPQGFGVLFALNSVAMIVGAQTNRVLARRFTTQRLLGASIGGATLFSIALTVASALGASFPIVAGCVLSALFFMGWITPNATSLALSRHHDGAGTASALLGVVQYAVGPLIGPLVSLADVSSLVLAVVMLCGFAAAAVLTSLAIGAEGKRNHHPEGQVLGGESDPS